jgi:hypothetical protein
MRLADAAYYYMRKHNRPIVLILDQVNRIAKQDPDFLGILQDFAKDHADRGSIIIVFIASEGLHHNFCDVRRYSDLTFRYT